MKSNRSFFLTALLALSLATAALTSANADESKSRSAKDTEKEINFWDESRISNAKSRDFQFDAGATVGKLISSTRSTATSSKPVASNIGSSWNNYGKVLAATGKVYFMVGINAYVCSGAVVADPDTARSIVLTAGHCVFDNATSSYVTNFIFIPAFDSKPTYTCANTSYGCWSAIKLVASPGFTSQTAFTTTATNNDWGFAVMSPGGKNFDAQLDATVGSYQLSTSNLVKGWTSYSFGYPQASPYTGIDLVYCNGATATDANSGNSTWKLGCNMTGGASGGPWFNTFTTNPVLSSVNSYKYSTDKNSMYGPMFNTNTLAAFNSALTWPIA